MSLSAASILHALLLGATASVTAGNGDVNPSMFTNGTETCSSADDTTERYICYLCTGRNPFLIRYCPIYWDECHLVCYDDQQASDSIPAVPVPTSLGPAASANPSELHEDECYVMKLYWNGSYAIVSSSPASAAPGSPDASSPAAGATWLAATGTPLAPPPQRRRRRLRSRGD